MSDSVKMKTFAYRRTDKPSRIVLDLNGTKINCKGSIDGLTLLEFAGKTGDAAVNGEDVASSASAVAVLDFLQDVIIDYDRFREIVKADDSGIGAAEIAEVASWLVEQYVEDRPTD